MTFPEDLESAWNEVASPTAVQAMAGRLAPDVDPELGITLAVDHMGLRHLLIPATEETKAPRRLVTKGLTASVEELKVGAEDPRWFLDVACADASMNANFSVVATEIVSSLVDDPTDPTRTLSDILARWRWFWSAPPAGMSEEAMVGLFGELWFLERWLGGCSDAALTAWRGPVGDRHDFTATAMSVEVKATRVRSDGSALHRVSTLEQLEDPQQGVLHVFSLRVRPDVLATHSLVASIDRLRQSVANRPELLATLDERLGRAGYSPAHRDKYAGTFRVVAEELYRVAEGFPRLTSDSFLGGVPAGVERIQYSIDLTAGQPWLIALAPAEDAAVEMRDGLLSS